MPPFGAAFFFAIAETEAEQSLAFTHTSRKKQRRAMYGAPVCVGFASVGGASSDPTCEQRAVAAPAIDSLV